MGSSYKASVGWCAPTRTSPASISPGPLSGRKRPSSRRAMAVGTAGLTAMLAVMALEHHGLRPGAGDILVTGAAGGVGSVAVSLLSRLGYRVVASTGRPELRDYLTGL